MLSSKKQEACSSSANRAQPL